MSLQEVRIKNEYRSLIDNVVQEFYIPLLEKAMVYRRAVGFFSSSALVEITKGIASMASNGGKIQIVASPYLSDEDIEAIQKGYAERDKYIERAVLRQITGEKLDYYSMQRLNLLACLIADGVLDIRIAYTEGKDGIGMYHEKMGLIEDKDGNVVAFSGSMNESATSLSVNYETIDVFRSWSNENDAERVRLKQNAFCSIWNDNEPNIKVLEFPIISQALIDKYKKSPPNYDVDREQFALGEKNTRTLGDGNVQLVKKAVGPRIPEDILLHGYQKEAIAAWVGENYRGIFDMATGTGKTFTGLGAISKLAEDINDELAVIIVCPYQHLVEQWVEDIVRFNVKPIIGYSSSPQRDWKQLLSNAVRLQKLRADKSFFCFVCTNATFKNEYVQGQINKIHFPVLLVVDEAHNFGAASYSGLLDNRFKYRLALSATLERHRDEEGTALLYAFFGKKCIEYPLDRAIAEDKLTPYRYYPVVVHLNGNELAEYEELSYKMTKCIIQDKKGKIKLNKIGEILALRRARIVAGASEKLVALRKVIKPYVHDNNILVYCGATNVLDENADSSSSDDGDIRQIEAVTRILGNELGMNVAQFTSNENMETRASIKEQFQRGDRLQAIVAIKCLDEGVNMPGIRTAFILASTTNPKEYIQRRGRVLRKAPNKLYAELYDFVTLPRPLNTVSSLTIEQAQRDVTLVRNELARIKEFGRLSQNSMEAYRLIWAVRDAYKITDEELEEGRFDYGAN
jgi:superfamily II DNA or RNA helicase